MGRKANVTPMRSLHVILPESLLAKVDALYFSEFENRVPLGSYQKFFTQTTREYFDTAELDLAPYVNSLPGEFVIRAAPATIDHLTSLLKRLT